MDQAIKLLTCFATELGPVYVKPSEIGMVSVPLKKAGHKPARIIGLSSGHTVYILDIDYNRDLLIGLGLIPQLEDIKEAMQHCGVEPEKPEVAKPKARRRKEPQS